MFGLEKYKKSTIIINTLIGLIVLIALGVACCHASIYGQNLMFRIGSLTITIFILPYLLVGALYGYLISSLIFVIAFISTLTYNMDVAYNMSIYLVAALCFSFFGQYLWFKNIVKTILAALITLSMVAFLETLCLSVIYSNSYSVDKLKDFGYFFTCESFVVVITALFFYMYYSKTSEIMKYPFPIAVAYTSYYQEEDVKRRLRKTKVSYKITTIIILVELLLGFFVAVFMMVLFPDLKEMFAANIHIGQITSDIEAAEIAQRIDSMNYRLDSTVISYDLKMMLLMLCIGVPMASIANFYTKVTIGAPLGNLSDFMQNYAKADDEKKLEAGRNVDSLGIKTHDEIEVVYESLKDTVHATEAYITRLGEEYELEKELEVAHQASEAKSAFLSSMSHEIRTPINAVLGLNEMILRESGETHTLEYANSVKSAGNSLLSIVNDILDFSKIEAGKMDIIESEYHLSSTINDLVNLIAVKAEDKHLELRFNIDKTLPVKLIGDEIRIKQCVTNILTNAVKYTEKGSVTLNVSYRKIDDNSIFLRFQVIDTGIGIKEEDLSKLYSPFERIEEIRNRSIEGTGLGTFVETTEAGEVENEPPVPIAQSAPQEAPAIQTRQGDNIELKVVRPETYEDVSTVADHLLRGCTVVLNLEVMERASILRMLDFLNGVTYATDGEIKKVAPNTYIVTAHGVDVTDAE